VSGLDFDKELVDTALGVSSSSMQVIHGGDIHRSYKINLRGGGSLFGKINDIENADVLMTESDSLVLLNRFVKGLYPEPYGYHVNERAALLLMSFHEMQSLNEVSSGVLGEQLALQHQITQQTFGWSMDNYIGRTVQQNSGLDCWLAFYRERRLEPQLQLAADRGLHATLIVKVEWLLKNLDDFIDQTAVIPSLLHGDLWGGNAASVGVQANNAMLYDPAPYFGDQEVDLAMTRLFGGFNDEFYRAYHQVIPARKGWQSRVKIYNLYHALNHYNMFGESYKNLVLECVNS